jgi:hypothetical protein
LFFACAFEFVFASVFALFVADAALAGLSAFEVLTAFSGLTGAAVLSALMAFAAFAAFAPVVARLAFPGWAVLALDDAEAVDASASTVEALGDAVLRRAGRADPEDVTMGFLREARVC